MLRAEVREEGRGGAPGRAARRPGGLPPRGGGALLQQGAAALLARAGTRSSTSEIWQILENLRKLMKIVAKIFQKYKF